MAASGFYSGRWAADCYLALNISIEGAAPKKFRNTIQYKKKFAQVQAFENRELGVNEQQKMDGRSMETLVGNPVPITGAGMPFFGMVGGGAVQPSAAGTAEMARMLLDRQPAGNFGGGSGTAEAEEAGPQQPARESFEQRAKKIKFLFDNGMNTQEQYQEKLTQRMNEI